MEKEIAKILDGMADFENRVSALENAQPCKNEQLSPDDLQVLDYAMIESHVKKAVSKELQQILLRLESLEQVVYKQKKNERKVKPKYD